MAGTAVPGRLSWRLANVVEVIPETARATTLVLSIDDWPGHRAGQHVDIRLTAEDGYHAERSYSIASAPGDLHVQLTVERLDDGEVSPYLTDELRPGDRFEVRGPIGGYFIWTPDDGGPLVLIGGGSGIVPLMAMIRARAQVEARPQVRLLGSFRAWDDIIYREEVLSLDEHDEDFHVSWTLTRAQPPGWSGYRRRIDAEMIGEAVGPTGTSALVYVCGPTAFVERASTILVDLGHDPARVRTERFGPSGG